MSSKSAEPKVADGVSELVLAVYPTVQCIWTSRGWRVIAAPEGGGEVKELARTSSAHVPEIEAWALAALAVGIFEPPPSGSRGDIAGQRILPDGRVQYLMHNKALCEPYYLAVAPKPSAEQPEKLPELLPELMALFLMNNCDGVSLDSIAVVARAVLRWQRCHGAMDREIEDRDLSAEQAAPENRHADHPDWVEETATGGCRCMHCQRAAWSWTAIEHESGCPVPDQAPVDGGRASGAWIAEMEGLALACDRLVLEASLLNIKELRCRVEALSPFLQRIADIEQSNPPAPIPVSPDPRVEEIRKRLEENLSWTQGGFTSDAKIDIRHLLSEYDRLRSGK